ncbi:hypothetical protein KKQ10_02615 [Pseudomonas sp. MG-9]|uniref:hypothetical protein n=1 Tax=Pseudomonas sp. MG-9 TaxID=2839032 RepID=UPI001C0030CB|nr:hypothetical protein [Pseudomonas sp. MG-9]MBT9263756.1 hypothetical protein [Pseudomonas sp. MG-9]
MKPKKRYSASGYLRATINDRTGTHEFTASEELEITEIAGQFKITAFMRDDIQTFRVIDLFFPKTLSNDGTKNEFSLKPSDDHKAQGRYSYFPGNVSLGSFEGLLTVHYDWKTAHMWGSFDYKLHDGDSDVEVNAGTFDLTGITVANLKGTGTFAGTLDSKPFVAEEVSIQRKQIVDDSYLEVVGRTAPSDSGLPDYAMIFLRINEPVTKLEHGLEDPNGEVHAECYMPLFGFFPAKSGKVIFESPPELNHVKGTIKGAFQQGQEQPREVDCTFDITNLPTQ